MKGKIFLDTNVFIYYFSALDQEKKDISTKIIAATVKSDRFLISYQVIQEFSNVMLTKGQPPLKEKDVSSLIDKILEPVCSFYPNIEFYKNALKFRASNKLSYYDSLIAVAALELECEYLFSEDFNDGSYLNEMKIVNPYKGSNQKLITEILKA